MLILIVFYISFNSTFFQNFIFSFSFTRQTINLHANFAQ